MSWKPRKLATVVGLFLAFSVMSASHASAVSIAAASWQFAGWFGGGAFPNIEFDPGNENRIFVTSDVAGLWKSDDLGESWVPINRGLGNIRISAVISAPSDPKVLYVASSRGVYRTKNSGDSWAAVGAPGNKFTFNRPKSYRPIAVDPEDSAHLCAGTTKGDVFCSESSGEKWTNLRADRVFDRSSKVAAIQFSPDGKSIVVASGRKAAKYDFSLDSWVVLLEENFEISDLNFSSGANLLAVAGGKEVSFSNDFGQTWMKTSPVPKGRVHRIEVLEVDGVTRLLVTWKEGFKGGLFFSEDKGKNWRQWGQAKNVDTELNPTRAWWPAPGRILSVGVSPHNPNIVIYTDWWGVFRSSDGGRTFQEKINGLANSAGSDIVFDRQENLWVATMDNGLLLSRDGGKSYLPVIPQTAGYRSEINGHVWRILDFSDRFLIATSSPWSLDINQIFIVDKSTLSFERVMTGLPVKRPKTSTLWGTGYPRAIAVGGKEAPIIYVGIDGTEGGLFSSRDGGKTFEAHKTQPPSFSIYNGLEAEKEDNGRIFWGSCDRDHSGGVWFFDAGTWHRSQIASACIFDIKRTPSGTIYAAGVGRGRPSLYRSIDRGQSFQTILSSKEGSAFEALAIHPRNEEIVAVSLIRWGGGSPGKILLSKNMGEDWEDMTGDLNIGSGAAAITFDRLGNSIYAALFAGSVYKTLVPPKKNDSE